MFYKIKRTAQFKHDYKLIKRRGYNVSLLMNVITILVSGKTLPLKYKDHVLSGDWVGYRECHIRPDWLLIYRVEQGNLVLILSRTGTHSDLFSSS
jgi:mRNA interferase YafQ